MTIGRVLRALLLLGVVLMPFSTGAGAGSVVVAYGLAPLLLLTALLLFGLLLRPDLPRGVGDGWLAGALLMFALAAGTVYAPRPMETLARSGPALLGFAAFAFVLSPFHPQPRSGSAVRLRAPRSEDLATLLVTAGTVLAAYFLVHYAVAVATNGLFAVLLDRVTGGVMSLPWGSSNVVASCFLFPIFLTFYGARGEVRRTQRWAMIGARLLMMAGLVATVSRGAIGAMLLGLFFHLVIAGRGRRTGLASGMVAVVLLAIGVDVANGGAYSTQLADLVMSRFDATEVRELNGRTEHWSEFADLFLAAPLLGTGYYGTMSIAGGTGHSLALTTLAERGLLGTLCSVAVLVLAAWRALAGRLRASDRADRLLFASILSGGAASLIHLMVEDANLTHQYIVYSWLALALPLAAWWERVERPATRPLRVTAAPEPAPAPAPS